MARSAADERPEAAAQLALLTDLAAETRAQVQREVEAVGAARAALETRQGEGEGVVAELEGQVEGFVSGWSSKIEALGATVDEATAALASRSERAHELGLRQQQAQQAELRELRALLQERHGSHGHDISPFPRLVLSCIDADRNEKWRIFQHF